MSDLRPIAPDLAKMIPLLSSDQPGEVVATAQAIGRKLSAVGCDFHDLAAAIVTLPVPHDPPPVPDPSIDEMVKRLAAIADTLPSKHREFVLTMARYCACERRISPKQSKYVEGLYETYADA